jgi:hypothetical protein
LSAYLRTSAVFYPYFFLKVKKGMYFIKDLRPPENSGKYHGQGTTARSPARETGSAALLISLTLPEVLSFGQKKEILMLSVGRRKNVDWPPSLPLFLYPFHLPVYVRILCNYLNSPPEPVDRSLLRQMIGFEQRVKRIF